MQWGPGRADATAAATRPLYVDALGPLAPSLEEGYPASDRTVAAKIAYVVFIFTWPMLLLSLVGIFGGAPVMSSGAAALLALIMWFAHRKARGRSTRSARLLALVATTGLAATLVGLEEGVDPALVGRPEIIMIIVVGLTAVLLTERQPLLMSAAWSLFALAAVAGPLFMLGFGAVTIATESLKAGAAFMAGSALMRIIHKTLQDRQNRYASLLELSAIGIMELDLTSVTARLRGLEIAGVTDFEAWLSEDPERTYDLVSYCKVVNMNHTMATMLGVDHHVDTVRNKTALVSSESVARTMQAHLLEMNNGAETASTQAVVVNKRGEARALILHTARRRTETGFDNAHVVLTAVDVEERREAETELQRQVSRREQLIASVSHELRTPMASVIGFADELLERPEDFGPAERRDLLEMIRSQSVDVANILDDLLVKARADFNDVAVMCDEVDVTTLTKRLLEELGMQNIRCDLDNVAVWADRTRLRQILRNLLTNARRYGGDEVRVFGEIRGNTAYISVRDNGEPLDLETSRNIFEAFERAHDRAGVTASVGLGLTISRQLAQAMDGEIWYAHDGVEAAFTVALPTAPSADRKRAAQPAQVVD